MRYAPLFPRVLVLLPLVLSGCSDESGEIPSTGLDQPAATEASPVFAAGGSSVASKFMIKGRFASLWTFDDGVSVGLTVGEGGPPQNPEAYLQVFIYDESSGRWSYGWGLIPAKDLTGTWLHTNTSTNPDFTVYTCWVVGEWEYTCEEDGPRGEIELVWSRTRFSSSSYKSHGRSTYGAYTSRWQGSWDSESASAEGQLYGWTISNSEGEIGKSRDRYMEIVRGQ